MCVFDPAFHPPSRYRQRGALTFTSVAERDTVCHHTSNASQPRKEKENKQKKKKKKKKKGEPTHHPSFLR
jgi:hypothetical protein